MKLPLPTDQPRKDQNNSFMLNFFRNAWLFAFDSVTTIIQVLHNEQIVV